MTNLDYQMGTILVFIIFLTIMAGMVHRNYINPMAGLIVFVSVLWGNDICSRNDQIAFFHDHFAKGDEILCQDAQILSISQSNGWSIKEHYALKGNRGIDLLEEQCEVPKYDTPNCISIAGQILSSIGALGWTIIFFIREFKRPSREREESETWIQGAESVTKEYVTDPELKEWNDFVGDVPKAYLRAELYPFDEFAANIETLLEKLSSGELDKIGIVYNDSLSAVVLSVRKKGEEHETC